MVIGYGETGGADVNELEQKGFKLKHIPMKRGSLNLVYNLITILKIWNFFREEKPDIAHLVTIKPYLIWWNNFTFYFCSVFSFGSIWTWNFIY